MTAATTPTEAEIRAYMETALADWEIAGTRILDDLKGDSQAFEEFIASEHVIDEDFHVFGTAFDKALDDAEPAMSAALRPLMIEAQVQAAVRFFEHYPEAPLAKPQLSDAS